VHTETEGEREREIVGYSYRNRKLSPLYAHMPLPCPFFETTPPGAAPGPSVKTGARVRRFRGCKHKLKAGQTGRWSQVSSQYCGRG